MQRIISDLPTALYQACGSTLYRLRPETDASQVLCADGSRLCDRLALLERNLAGNTTTHLCRDLAGRDALIRKIPGDRAWVCDASADPAIGKGSAIYMWLPPDGWILQTAAQPALDPAQLCGAGLLQDAQGRLAIDWSFLDAQALESPLAALLGPDFLWADSQYALDWNRLPEGLLAARLRSLLGAGLAMDEAGRLSATGLQAEDLPHLLESFAGPGLAWQNDRFSLAPIGPDSCQAGFAQALAASLLTSDRGLALNADGCLVLALERMDAQTLAAQTAVLAGPGLILAAAGKLAVDFEQFPASLFLSRLAAMLPAHGPLYEEGGFLELAISDATDQEDSRVCASLKAVARLRGLTLDAGQNARLALEQAASLSSALTSLEARAGDLETALPALEERTDVLETALPALESRTAALESSLPALAGNLDAAKADLASLTENQAQLAQGQASLAQGQAQLAAALDGKADIGHSHAATPQATPQAAGLMSAADKSKLDGIAAGAQVNQTVAQLALNFHQKYDNIVIENNNPLLLFRKMDMDALQTPQGTGIVGVQPVIVYDKNNQLLYDNICGRAGDNIYLIFKLAGSTGTLHNMTLLAGAGDADFYLQMPEPPAGANNTYVPNTSWVRARIAAATGKGATTFSLAGASLAASQPSPGATASPASTSSQASMQPLQAEVMADGTLACAWQPGQISPDMAEAAMACVKELITGLIFQGFAYELCGGVYYFSYDLYDQQNLADAALAALAGEALPLLARNEEGVLEELRPDTGAITALHLYASRRKSSLQQECHKMQNACANAPGAQALEWLLEDWGLLPEYVARLDARAFEWQTGEDLAGEESIGLASGTQ